MTWKDRASLAASYSSTRAPNGSLLTLCELSILEALANRPNAFVASQEIIGSLAAFRGGNTPHAVLGAIVRALRGKGYAIDSARVLRGLVKRGLLEDSPEIARGTRGYRLRASTGPVPATMAEATAPSAGPGGSQARAGASARDKDVAHISTNNPRAHRGGPNPSLDIQGGRI